MIMKKKIGFLIAAVLLAGSLSAQASGGASSHRTAHYEFIAEAGAEDSLPYLAREMELRFEEYNRLFRFNPAVLPSPLRVRVFQDPAAYDSYISARLGNSRAGAVYLHYNNIERRELVINRGSAEEAFMLAHQAFIQFFRGFFPNPPSWMREGFAIYFNSLDFDPGEETLAFEENLDWLETARNISSRNLSPREILLRDTVQIHDISEAGSIGGIYSRDFQIASWALVSFFMNSAHHFRSLTDSFMVLSPQFSAAQNSQEVMNRLSLWIDFYDLDVEFQSYLDFRRTFAELMENGARSFAAGDLTSAELSFLIAQSQRPAHFGPYYYLGLIYYEGELFDLAEESFLLSLEHGGDEALISFALGLNAVSEGRTGEGRSWLERAAAADPDRYRLRVETLLERLR